MKILLINPQTPNIIKNKEYYIPLSLLYLSSVLQKSRDEVSILDLNIYKPWIKTTGSLEKYCENIIIEHANNFKPEFTGITCLFSGQFPSVLYYSKLLKKYFKSICIAIGGIHPTIFSEEILMNCPSIDFVVIGEGEETFRKLIDRLKNNRNDYNDLDGIAYRRNGNVIVNKKVHFISNPDDVPFPAYDLINTENYCHDTSNWHNPKNMKIDFSIPIITSRSCPMGCNFCSMYLVMGKIMRLRSPKNVIDELEVYYYKYNHRHFSFMDDNLTLNKKHVIEICKTIIERKLNIQFETPNGVSLAFIDEEMLAALVEAGLVRVALAIESGSDYIRNKVMKKQLPREKIYEVIKLTRKYKQLYVKTFFIMGMPEDTRETLMETYNMIEELRVDKPMMANLIPFPGTKLFKQAVRDKLFSDKMDMNNLWSMSAFYYTDNKEFFIKPYKMDFSELHEYRLKFDTLIREVIAQRKKEREMSNI